MLKNPALNTSKNPAKFYKFKARKCSKIANSAVWYTSYNRMFKRKLCHILQLAKSVHVLQLMDKM